MRKLNEWRYLMKKYSSAHFLNLTVTRQQSNDGRGSSSLGVELRVVLVADFLVGAMEVLHIVNIEVGGGDIGSSSEPPDSSLSFLHAVNLLPPCDSTLTRHSQSICS